jgi:hypothetical protein
MLPVLLALAAAIPAAPATTQPTAPEEKLICKREPVTGSLARFRKICKTATQWVKSEDSASTEAQRMQDRGSQCAGSGETPCI